MKKILYIATLLILATYSTTQAQTDVETPVITSIEVNEEGIPVISWQISDPELVDGYIVKRLIVDGKGVISGTYNNVAVIEDNQTFSYTDRSNEYGTYAMPGVRKEYYCIAAYSIDSDGQKHYSLMSEPASTVTVQGSFDYCSSSYTLQYSKMDDPGSYTIMLEPWHYKIKDTSDTTYTFYSQPVTESRAFRIQWTGDNGITTYSPVIDIKGENPVAPDTTRISYITVNDNNQITLKLTASESPSSASALLVRRNKANGTEITHPLPEHIMHDYVYIDQEASPDSSYAYLLIITDKCGHQISESDSAYNVVASVAAAPNNSNLVSWNTLLLTSGIISTNTILRSVDNGEWEPIANVTERYNEYSDPLSNMIADDNMYSGQFCYRVQITRTNGDIINSNIACLQREPVIYIPNALNPNSDIMDNRTFRPRADFLSDYHLAIYDKRGALLFQSDDLNVGWDGYDRQSKLCHRDTYIYHISYKTSSGKQISKSGMVNLLY